MRIEEIEAQKKQEKAMAEAEGQGEAQN